MVDPWLGFLNEQATQEPSSPASLDRAKRRQSILDRAACSFPFPLEITCRAVVIDRRDVNGEPHLVLAPDQLSPEALDVVGGVVVPSDRELFEGSVAEVTCRLLDPDAYWIEDGVLASEPELDVIVPIEP